MPLDDDIRRYLEAQAAMNLPKIWEVPLEHARRAARAPHLVTDARTPVREVEDRTIPGPGGELPIRVYRPEGAGPHPGVLFLHGGGYVTGDLDTHDDACRRLCSGAACTVVAVDYRLAPEARFPAAVEDAVAAAYWTARNASELGIDPTRSVVAGDSAGGTLAAVVARRLRDEDGPPLAGQLLIYPPTDMRTEVGTADYPSRRDNGEGYGLSQRGMEWFAQQYLPDADAATHPDASPILAQRLDGLPPALVLTAEYDPLRDEGEAYAARLREAGVPVEHHRLPGTIHGIFVTPERFASRAEAWRLSLSWLRRTVAVS